MFQVTRLQGDTDTNCAIVGGILGAYVGVDKIDRHKLRTLLECRTDKARAVSSMGGASLKFIMPGWGCIDQMLQLLSIAPTNLEVVTEYVD